MTRCTPIESVAIIVPARNEEELLPRCLNALTEAIGCLRAAHGTSSPTVSVVIVLDQCTDASAAVVARWPAFDSIVTDAGAVGAARRSGVRHLVGRQGQPATTTWLATTDADSAVPSTWLTTQLAFARNGTELVLGTVWPDAALTDAEQERWASKHSLVEGHPYVHGANLGIRADRYLEAGGFPPVDIDEDVLLVSALRALRVSETRTARIPVLTSGRLNGRAPGGFAGQLRERVEV